MAGGGGGGRAKPTFDERHELHARISHLIGDAETSWDQPARRHPRFRETRLSRGTTDSSYRDVKRQTTLIIPRHNPINALTMGAIAKDAGLVAGLVPPNATELGPTPAATEPTLVGTVGLLTSNTCNVFALPFAS